MMEFPPSGMFSHMAKAEGLGNRNGQHRHGIHGKYLPSVESHQWHLSVFINGDGHPEIRCSPFLEHFSKEWLQPVAEHLRQLYEARVSGSEEIPKIQMKSHRSDGSGLKQPMWPSQPPCAGPQYFVEGYTPYAIHANPKRRRVDSQPPEGQDPRLSAPGSKQSISSSRVAPQMEPLGCGAGGAGDGDVSERSSLSIKVSETARWEAWFADAFKAIQQQACRFIAKEWIKLIHPKKQSTHPYNGNFPRHGTASPERTRPPYWPAQVRHKEPDHIDKDARTILLVHLLTGTPQQEITPANIDGRSGTKEITARDLLAVLTKRKDEYKDKWEIIEMLIHTRSELENFEEGGMDPDTVLTVPDYHENVRLGSNGRRLRTKPKTPARTEPQEATNEGDESRPTSPAPPVSPAGSTATPAASENEDDLSGMNASFDTTISLRSSRSSGPPIRPKLEGNSKHHAHVDAQANAQHQPMLVDPNPPGLDYDHHNGMHSRQPNIPNPWPTTSATDARLTEAYANNAMIIPQEVVQSLGSAQFDHNMYTTPRHDVMTMIPYPDQNFMFDFSRNMPYRVPDMSHDLEAQADFLQDQYCPGYPTPSTT